MRPLIGITQRLREGAAGRRDRLQLDPAYAAAVAAAGGVPVHVPLQDDAEAVVRRLDALVVPGGPDFPPPRPYPEGVVFDLVAARQLAFDRAVLDAAFALARPVLGICYGMQLLAVHGGGALHHHLPLDLPDAREHARPGGDAHHELYIEEPSLLARLLDGCERVVNSRHHQAVSDPGPYRVSARAEDAVIEAIEREGGPFCLGVQWHPEAMDPAHRAGIFGGLVAACAGR